SGLPTAIASDIVVTGPSGFSRALSASGALVDISPGRYVVSARPVRTGEGTFAATPSEQAVDVMANAPPSLASVSYGFAPAVVGVTVRGLPANAGSAITLTPPNGVEVNIGGTSRHTGLAGRWSLRADAVKSGGFTYLPTPATAENTLLPGDSVGLGVDHVLATGAIAFVVSGLPSGSNATYAINGPGGTRTSTGTSTITDLDPGQYTISAPVVDGSGGRFRPQPATQLVTVAPSLVATPATISYAAVTSTLVLTVSGAPTGSSDMLRVTGPNGFARMLGATSTLSDIAPGSYTITALDIVQPTATWRALTATTVRSITGEATDSVGVQYAVATGSLAVSMSGVPAGSNGVATISGPGGFSRAMTSSATLVGLVPGDYILSAAPVTANGDSYAASPATQSVTVQASLVAATVSVVYRVRAAALVVRIDGMPSGAEGMVRVSGPNFFERTLSGTTTLEGLTPGTYTISASEIVQPSAVYRPSPSNVQRTLLVDSRDTVNMTYAIATGMVAVTVSGLPAGTNANMQLSGPNGYLVPVTSTSTFVRLVPGTYALVASTVSASGTSYVPAPQTQQIPVAASPNAAGATVTYGAATPNGATLVVSISGAPAGGSPSVTITGPSGYTRTVTSTTTITSLAPGVYNATAASFTVGSSTYTPSPSSAQRTLASGGSDNIGVTYTTTAPPPPGQLAVTINGLPSGVNADVVLTGASSSHNIASSSTITGLAPGSYTLSAATVTNGSTTYTAAPSSQSVTITSGATSNATVTYSTASAPPPGGDDLSVEFAYLTQAVQRPDGSVPLVAGRDALLRVFVKNSRTNLLRPDVRVRVYDGATLLQTVTIPAPELMVRTALAEGALGSTWNTVIAAANVRTSLRIVADVDPSNAVATDGDRSNNVWPRGGTPQAVSVNSVPAFNVRFIPVTVGALSGNISAASMSQYLRQTKMLHPLATVTADVRLPFTSSASVMQANDDNDAWLTVLSEVNALRASDNAPSNMHYYGVVKVGYTSGIAGLGYVPGRAAIGWDHMPSGDGVAAHEWGHNFSRPHSPCGVSGDASYPYSGGTIGYYGWNSTSNSLVAPAATDYMGYCNNNWTSDWSWNKIMTYRQTSGLMSNVTTDAGGEGLLVWGRVVNGRVVLEPAFRVKAPVTARATNGLFRVEALDANGARLLDIPVDAPLVDHSNGAERQFAVVVPWSAELDATLTTLRVHDVRSPLAAAARTSDAARRAGARAGDVRIESEQADPGARIERTASRERLQWNRAAYPMAMVRDVATGQTIAFLRQAGDAFAPRGRTVDIVLSDGVRSVVRRVRPGAQPE
ncbi:MAG: hypothetical protein ABIW79_02300, partial [Gemmatimonas sp.]